MTHPCAASRLSLKGAMPAARQSRFCGIPGSGTSLRKVRRLVSPSESSLCPSQPCGGHITGMLRVEAVSKRRASASLGRAWV
jgi:hypothetical protein